MDFTSHYSPHWGEGGESHLLCPYWSILHKTRPFWKFIEACCVIVAFPQEYVKRTTELLLSTGADVMKRSAENRWMKSGRRRSDLLVRH